MRPTAIFLMLYSTVLLSPMITAQDAPAAGAQQAAIDARVSELSKLLKRGDSDAALEALDDLISALPSIPDQLLTKKLDLLCGSSDKFEDAVAFLASVNEDFANSPSTLNALAWRVVEISEARHESKKQAELPKSVVASAISLTEKALGSTQDDPAILDTQANLIAITGDVERAIEIQDKAVEACKDPKLKWQLEDTLRKFKIEVSLTPEQEETLRKVSQIEALAMSAYRNEDFRSSLDLFRRAGGSLEESRLTQHPEYASSLSNLAGLHYYVGDNTTALSLYQKVLVVRKTTLGEWHPQYATSLEDLARLHQWQDDYQSALPLKQEALEIRKTTLGEWQPQYATCLEDLARLHQSLDDFMAALPLKQEALEIRKAVQGERHPDYSLSLNDLARLHQFMGDYEAALPLFREALKIRNDVLGEQHPDYATSLNNLAGVHVNMGDYKAALPLFQQALNLRKAVVGEQHPDYAMSLNNLAYVHQSTGDYQTALKLYQQALEINQVVHGKEHPVYAISLNNLAGLFRVMGDYKAALPLAQETHKVYELLQTKHVLSEQHPDYAMSLNSLAGLHLSAGDYRAALPLFRRALRIHETVLGEQHPDYALILHNLAGVLMKMGDYKAALPLAQQALKIYESKLGDQHPDYAMSKKNLALLNVFLGDYLAAQLQLQQVANSAVDGMGDFAAVLSERQQKTLLADRRHGLNSMLSNCFRITGRLEPTLEIAWRWKGFVTLRQQAFRRVANEPDLKPLFDEFRSVSVRLSAISGRVPLPPPLAAKDVEKANYKAKKENWERQFKELRTQREELEAAIALKSEAFRQVTSTLTVEEVQNLLTINSVFVDFLEYNHSKPDPEKPGKFTNETRYLAFFVPKQGPVSMLPLGSAEEIKLQISAFRRQFQPNANLQKVADAVLAGKRLRKLIWEPIAAKLNGEDTIIISPDTEISALPFAALPAEKPDSYLIEDFKFSFLPLAGMLRGFTEDSVDRSKTDKGLLVMGDVDYNRSQPNREVSPGKSEQEWLVAARSNLGSFKDLAFAHAELDSITDLFKQEFGDPTGESLSVLIGKAATEAEFMRQAPRHRNLHVITHGFFVAPKYDTVPADPFFDNDSPEDVFAARSELGRTVQVERYLPNLLTGLAMAGANEPPMEEDSEDDGILTAAEIESLYLDSVDLVVLSACETGLGKSVQGEGLTGLQRAFHLAGAKSVVASLWQVPDKATSELMRRFYTYYWHDGLPKIDALRRAQLDILRNPQLTDGSGGRGLGAQQTTAKSDKPSAPDAPTRSSPFYWAAFQLSGDWR